VNSAFRLGCGAVALWLLTLQAAHAGPAEPPKLNPNAEADGQALVAQLRAQVPAQDFTNHGRLLIRPAKGQGLRRAVPVQFQVFTTGEGWTSVYEAAPTNREPRVRLTVRRTADGATEYRLGAMANDGSSCDAGQVLAGAATMTPFAGSDFWVADLGLEFLRWPGQRLLRKEMTRGQSCNLLESLAPKGQTNGYVRVKSWLDIDTGGVVFAEAYDVQGRLVKEFAPKGVKKVNGRWELEEMEISNRQTGSRTRIHFDFAREPAPAR
jgi:hypothetical protein